MLSNIQKELTKTKQELVDFIESHFADFDISVGGIREILESPHTPEEIRSKILHEITKVVHLALKSDNVYTAEQFADLSDDLLEHFRLSVKERIKQGNIIKEGNSSMGLFDITLKLGGPEDIRRAIKEYARAVIFDDEKYRMDFEIGQLQKIGEMIKIKREKYCEENNISCRPYTDNMQTNASVELSKMDYDLIIGVLKGGDSIPINMEILGNDVRFIEWRKHGERKDINKNYPNVTKNESTAG